jgi:exodeoxyribonuclease VII large subunit
VQGAGAAAELVAALADAAAVRADLVLLARGGGSLEDLWAFNEESLVRAVAACPVPVISAVGHETDVTLCDFAADLRAITPTDGARRAVAGWEEVAARVAEVGARLQRAALARTQRRRAQLDRAMRDLLRQEPRRRLDRMRWAVAELHRRLLESGAAGPAAGRRRALACARRLERRDPAARAALLRARLGALRERLDAANPHGLLARGWALVEARGRAGFLRRAQDVAPGDALRIRLAEGELAARVE